MQYIGARYVPKFMGLYDATQTYEALCVVDNGMGTSYITKVPTPAGTPLTDTDYYAIYGASSGAIINLQNQIGDLTDLNTTNKDNLVDAVNDNVSKIQDLTNIITPRRFILMDSYGGYPDDTLSVYLALYLGVEYTAETPVVTGNHDIRYKGGIGFTNVNGQGTFESFLSSIAGEITDPSKIDEIIVLGGANDYGGNGVNIENGINSFCTYVNVLMPNAKIKIGCLSAPRSTRANIENHRIAISAYRNCYKYGAEYLDNVEYIMHVKSMYYDSTHPTTAIMPFIARKVSDAILFGACEINYIVGENLAANTLTGDFDTFTLSNSVIDGSVSNGITSLNIWFNAWLKRSNGTSINLQNYSAKLCTLNDSTKIIVGRSLGTPPFIGAMPVELDAYLSNAMIDSRMGYLYIDSDGDLAIFAPYGSNGGLVCDSIKIIAEGNSNFASITC